jgi:hypothetical protein
MYKSEPLSTLWQHINPYRQVSSRWDYYDLPLICIASMLLAIALCNLAALPVVARYGTLRVESGFAR